MNERGVLLGHLPAIYHSWEALARLLAAFEEVLFGPAQEGAIGSGREGTIGLPQKSATGLGQKDATGSWQKDAAGLGPEGATDPGQEGATGWAPDGAPGLAQRIAAIPDLFAVAASPGAPGRPQAVCPEPFVAWLAQWVAFTPCEGFSTAELRRIVAGIVPLYPMRGTKAYLEALLRLCVPQIERVTIDDRFEGLTLGRSTLGADSFLMAERPYWFRVDVRVPAAALDTEAGPRAKALFEAKVARLIDFAKPAHTGYELSCEFDERAAGSM